MHNGSYPCVGWRNFRERARADELAGDRRQRQFDAIVGNPPYRHIDRERAVATEEAVDSCRASRGGPGGPDPVMSAPRQAQRCSSVGTRRRRWPQCTVSFCCARLLAAFDMPTDSTSLTDADRSVIKRFRPQRKDLVRDTAASAGIPTGHWKANDDPAFRSEWCFGVAPGPAVLFIDHVDLRALDGTLRPCYRSNLRDEAIQLKREADELGLSGAAVSGQIERAGKFDMLLMHSARQNSPLQVALLAGSIKKRGRDKRDRYSVDLRQLDTHLWRVMHYNVTTGDHLLVRTDVVATPESIRKPFDADFTLTTEPSAAAVAVGAQAGARKAPAPVVDVPPAPATPAEPLLVDQFSLPGPPRREEVTLSRVRRDPAVRQEVLRRAGGRCELCSTPGFRTLAGALYLETHHVVPLEDEGADAEWNMAAICPGEHREAHYGERAQAIGQRLLAFLIERYPARETVIRAQARRARELRAQRQPCVLA